MRSSLALLSLTLAVLAAPASAQAPFVLVDAPERPPAQVGSQLLHDLRAAYPDIVFTSEYAASIDEAAGAARAMHDRPRVHLRFSLRVDDGVATLRGTISSAVTSPRRVHLDETFHVDELETRLLGMARTLLDDITVLPAWRRLERAAARRARRSEHLIITPSPPPPEVPEPPRPPLRWRRNGPL